MQVKKFGALIAASTLAFSLFSSSAVANLTPQATASTATPALSPEILNSMQAKMEIILALGDKQKGLEASIKTQDAAHEALWTQMNQAASGDLVKEIKERSATQKAATELAVKPFREQAKVLEAQLAKARASQDQAQIMLLRAELQDLRTQIQSELAQLRSQAEQIALLKAKLDARRATLKAGMAQDKSLQETDKALWIDVHTLTADRNVAWKSFDAALIAGDALGIISSLDIVIAKRQAIVASLDKILKGKVAVNGLLNTNLSALNSGTVS
jgi:hypothetical protein